MARPGRSPNDETVQLEHVRDDLRREFPAVPGDVVDHEVEVAEQRLRTARVRSFVPVLVRRGARQRLRELR